MAGVAVRGCMARERGGRGCGVQNGVYISREVMDRWAKA